MSKKNVMSQIRQRGGGPTVWDIVPNFVVVFCETPSLTLTLFLTLPLVKQYKTSQMGRPYKFIHPELRKQPKIATAIQTK